MSGSIIGGGGMDTLQTNKNEEKYIEKNTRILRWNGPFSKKNEFPKLTQKKGKTRKSKETSNSKLK